MTAPHGPARKRRPRAGSRAHGHAPGAAPAPGSGGRGGFVLVAALWLIVALGAVALDVSTRTRARRMAAAHTLDEGRARAIAMGGAEYARSRLGTAVLGLAEEMRAEVVAESRSGRLSERSESTLTRSILSGGDPGEDPWREPETLVVTEHAMGDTRFTLHLRDTGAALNLNDATEDMLRQFFSQGLRVDYALGDRLAQAIVDWRDEDQIPLLNGAEVEQYLRDEAPMLPADRPFDDLAELRWVRGMTEEIHAAALPYLTLTSSGRVNLNAAPEPVLLALPGMTPAAAGEILRLRAGGAFPRSRGQLEDMLSAGAWAGIERVEEEFARRVVYSTDEVEIVADGWVEGSPVRVRTWMVVARSASGARVVWRKVDS